MLRQGDRSEAAPGDHDLGPSGKGQAPARPFDKRGRAGTEKARTEFRSADRHPGAAEMRGSPKSPPRRGRERANSQCFGKLFSPGFPCGGRASNGSPVAAPERDPSFHPVVPGHDAGLWVRSRRESARRPLELGPALINGSAIGILCAAGEAMTQRAFHSLKLTAATRPEGAASPSTPWSSVSTRMARCWSAKALPATFTCPST